MTRREWFREDVVRSIGLAAGSALAVKSSRAKRRNPPTMPARGRQPAIASGRDTSSGRIRFKIGGSPAGGSNVSRPRSIATFTCSPDRSANDRAIFEWQCASGGKRRRPRSRRGFIRVSGRNPRSVAEYRNGLLFGTGLNAGMTAGGVLFIDDLETARSPAVDLARDAIELRLLAQPRGDHYAVTLSVSDVATGARPRRATGATSPPTGWSAASHSWQTTRRTAALEARRQRLASSPRRIQISTAAAPSGLPIGAWEDRRSRGTTIELSGQSYFAQYTLSRRVLKLTAQMPPLGRRDSQIVAPPGPAGGRLEHARRGAHRSRGAHGHLSGRGLGRWSRRAIQACLHAAIGRWNERGTSLGRRRATRPGARSGAHGGRRIVQSALGVPQCRIRRSTGQARSRSARLHRRPVLRAERRLRRTALPARRVCPRPAAQVVSPRLDVEGAVARPAEHIDPRRPRRLPGQHLGRGRSAQPRLSGERRLRDAAGVGERRPPDPDIPPP